MLTFPHHLNHIQAQCNPKYPNLLLNRKLENSNFEGILIVFAIICGAHSLSEQYLNNVICRNIKLPSEEEIQSFWQCECYSFDVDGAYRVVCCGDVVVCASKQIEIGCDIC